MYAPNNIAPKYRKQKLTELKEETDHLTTIVGDFSTPFSIMGRTTKQKVTGNQRFKQQYNTTDIYRILHSTKEYIFLSSVHGRFFRIGHVLIHETSLNTFTSIEVT